MSNIIKSFRVIESNKSMEVNNDINENQIEISESILEEAREEYDRLISMAEEKSQQIIEEAEVRQESLINDAYNKAREVLEESKEEGFNQGYQNGFEEGYQKGYEEGKLVSDNLIQESLELKQWYIDKKAKLIKELETDIITLVTSIYEKIINKANEEDNELIISLVLNGINNLDLTDKLTIIVSKDDYNVLEMSRDEILAKASMISELDIKYDMSFEKGECILETTKGNIDASLKNQLDEVRELLNNILNNE